MFLNRRFCCSFSPRSSKNLISTLRDVKKKPKKEGKEMKERMNLHSIQEWELLRNSPELEMRARNLFLGSSLRFLLPLMMFPDPIFSLTLFSFFLSHLICKRRENIKVNKNFSSLGGFLCVCMSVFEVHRMEFLYSHLFLPPSDRLRFFDFFPPQKSRKVFKRYFANSSRLGLDHCMLLFEHRAQLKPAQF